MLIDALILDCRVDKHGDRFTPDCLKEIAGKPLSGKNNAVILNSNPKDGVGQIQNIWYKNRKLYVRVELNKKLGTTIIEKYILSPAIKIIECNRKNIEGKIIRTIKKGELYNLSLIDRDIRAVVNATMVFRKKEVK